MIPSSSTLSFGSLDMPLSSVTLRRSLRRRTQTQRYVSPSDQDSKSHKRQAVLRRSAKKALVKKKRNSRSSKSTLTLAPELIIHILAFVDDNTRRNLLQQPVSKTWYSILASDFIQARLLRPETAIVKGYSQELVGEVQIINRLDYGAAQLLFKGFGWLLPAKLRVDLSIGAQTPLLMARYLCWIRRLFKTYDRPGSSRMPAIHLITNSVNNDFLDTIARIAVEGACGIEVRVQQRNFALVGQIGLPCMTFPPDHFRNLESFSFTGSGFLDLGHQAFMISTLSQNSVRYLSLSDWGVSCLDWPQIYTSINLPNLRTIHLAGLLAEPGFQALLHRHPLLKHISFGELTSFLGQHATLVLPQHVTRMSGPEDIFHRLSTSNGSLGNTTLLFIMPSFPTGRTWNATSMTALFQMVHTSAHMHTLAIRVDAFLPGLDQLYDILSTRLSVVSVPQLDIVLDNIAFYEERHFRSILRLLRFFPVHTTVNLVGNVVHRNSPGLQDLSYRLGDRLCIKGRDEWSLEWETM